MHKYYFHNSMYLQIICILMILNTCKLSLYLFLTLVVFVVISKLIPYNKLGTYYVVYTAIISKKSTFIFL